MEYCAIDLHVDFRARSHDHTMMRGQPIQETVAGRTSPEGTDTIVGSRCLALKRCQGRQLCHSRGTVGHGGTPSMPRHRTVSVEGGIYHIYKRFARGARDEKEASRFLTFPRILEESSGSSEQVPVRRFWTRYRPFSAVQGLIEGKGEVTPMAPSTTEGISNRFSGDLSGRTWVVKGVLVVVFFALHFPTLSCSSMSETSKSLQSQEVLSEICPFAQDTYLYKKIVASSIGGSVYVDGRSIVGENSAISLANVLVVLFSGPYNRPEVIYRAVTAGDGSFTFESLKPGEYTLLTCLDGFDAAEFPVTIQEDGLHEDVMIKLSPS